MARRPQLARRRDQVPAGARRYLLDSERLVFAVRRHPAVLTGPVLVYGGLLLLAGLLLWAGRTSQPVTDAGVVVLLTATAWCGWRVGDWWVERFTVTDRRVLLVSGLLTRRVAIMPLRKVTDLSFERSLTGRLLGFGAFVMESAGQQQALRRVDYLPRPEQLYVLMSTLLFGAPTPPGPLRDDDDEPLPRPVGAERSHRTGGNVGPLD